MESSPAVGEMSRPVPIKARSDGVSYDESLDVDHIGVIKYEFESMKNRQDSPLPVYSSTENRFMLHPFFVRPT